MTINTPISKTRFFSNEAMNFDFTNMVKNNNKLKTLYKNSENLKEFFEKCLNDENRNENFYMFISKFFSGHQERVSKLFMEHEVTTTSSDMASVMIYNDHAELFIKNSSKSDGTNLVAVFDKDDNRINDFMEKADVLVKGNYTISASDCKKSPTNLELSGLYEVFTASIDNNEFIAFKKISD